METQTYPAGDLARIVDPVTMYVWVDIETTGLPSRDGNVAGERVIEIGILATDLKLQAIDHGFSCVVDPGEYDLSTMHPKVIEMHTENGLLDDIKNGNCLPRFQAERLAVAYLKDHFDGGTMPMAGSSIRFDRQFLSYWMPKVDSYFHYRIIDVSSLKEVWKRQFPDMPKPKKEKAHRVLDDCRASIAELKFYLDHLGLKAVVA